MNPIQFDKRRHYDQHRRSDAPSARKIPEYSLNIEPAETVHVLRGLGQAVKWPGKLKSPEDQRDRSRFCDFHNGHGHRTNECIALRLEVADLLKRGLLTDLLTSKGKETWIQSNKNTNGNATPHPAPPRIDRTLNCITGGSEVSGISVSGAKRSNRTA